MYIYVYIYMYIYTGLEIGGIASPNANHFWGNCESLRQSDSPNFFGTANPFWPIAKHFSMDLSKDLYFLVLTFF